MLLDGMLMSRRQEEAMDQQQEGSAAVRKEKATVVREDILGLHVNGCSGGGGGVFYVSRDSINIGKNGPLALLVKQLVHNKESPRYYVDVNGIPVYLMEQQQIMNPDVFSYLLQYNLGATTANKNKKLNLNLPAFSTHSTLWRELRQAAKNYQMKDLLEDDELLVTHTCSYQEEVLPIQPRGVFHWLFTSSHDCCSRSSSAPVVLVGRMVSNSGGGGGGAFFFSPQSPIFQRKLLQQSSGRFSTTTSKSTNITEIIGGGDITNVVQVLDPIKGSSSLWPGGESVVVLLTNPKIHLRPTHISLRCHSQLLLAEGQQKQQQSGGETTPMEDHSSSSFSETTKPSSPSAAVASSSSLSYLECSKDGMAWDRFTLQQCPRPSSVKRSVREIAGEVASHLLQQDDGTTNDEDEMLLYYAEKYLRRTWKVVETTSTNNKFYRYFRFLGSDCSSGYTSLAGCGLEFFGDIHQE